MGIHTATAGTPVGQGWLRSLASRRLTVLFFLLTAGSSLMVAQYDKPATLWMLAPFGLLVVNIIAAIFTSARFRADVPLLLFHVCLVALVALVGVGRLTYLEAQTSLTSGTEFDGYLNDVNQGPLHPGSIEKLRFVNLGFTEGYFRRGAQRATYNRVRWQDDAGQWHLAEIGNDLPLILHGYRIHTSKNRGFSPLFHWQPAEGEGAYGTVQLSDHDVNSLSPSVEWMLPGGIAARATLELKARHSPGDDLKGLDHVLALKLRGERHELTPGKQVALPEGTLTYVRLDSWMGYAITYDPTKPWVMATILIGVASLIWFYWKRIW